MPRALTSRVCAVFSTPASLNFTVTGSFNENRRVERCSRCGCAIGPPEGISIAGQTDAVKPYYVVLRTGRDSTGMYRRWLLCGGRAARSLAVLGSAVECGQYFVLHIRFRSRLAGPDLELACALLHEHLVPRNYGRATRPRDLHELRLALVNHVHDVARFHLFFVQRRSLGIFTHSHRSGVDDDIGL